MRSTGRYRQPAPEARQKVARGKRAARRPWNQPVNDRALKGRKEPLDLALIQFNRTNLLQLKTLI